MHPPAQFVRKAAKIALATSVIAATALAGTPAHAGEGDIVGANHAHRIKDSYIVVLKDTTTAVDTTSRRLTERHGGVVKHRYQAALRGFSVTITEQAARRIAADPAVAYVEADQTVQTLDTQTNPPSWGLDRIDQRNLPLNNSYTYPNTASNVRAYIIDTGIRITHSDFGSRATWGTNTTGDGQNTDCSGHGTHVAGTVGGNAYGVAKSVRLVAVKVLNCAGNGTTSGVIAGVDWVTSNAIKPAVANMSLGGGASATLDNAVTRSISSGITYAVAAGNENANACNYSPARVPDAITVGATDRNDRRAPYSNWGPCLTLFAPGSSITSAWHTGDTATNTINGTSMASPHVAGAAALALSDNPSWSPLQVRNHLINIATPGVVIDPGPGSPNLLLNVGNSGGGGTCSPGQKLANPGFESGSTGWTASSGVIGAWGNARSGSYSAWHNGYGYSTTNYTYQNVTLPSGCSSYTLSFYLRISTAETSTTTAWDTFRVQILNSTGSTVLATLATYSNLNAASGYSLKSFNLSAYAGQTIRVQWYGQEDSILATSFILDDTAVTVS
ncbi:MAG TPA: S8 family serine peptidase [Micromonospora sp.]|nr:S8 family serine peptidase [Micromonospora sp.]